jgi:hypothetical protein
MCVFFEHFNFRLDYIHRSYTSAVATAVIVSTIRRRKREIA